jgi:hypothetical protein
LSTTSFVLGIVALGLVWFVMLWLAVSYTIALVAGWRRLRQHYATSSFDGPSFPSAGYVGPSRYRGGALIVGATPAGLYLNVAAPFRIGAGPVLVPWQEIRVSKPGNDLMSTVTFELPEAGTRLRVAGDVADRLLALQRGVT